MMGGVNHGLEVGVREEGDPFAVGGPRGCAVGAGIGGDLREVRALVGIIGGHDPDIGIVAAIRISAAVAGEGEVLAVGGPGGLVGVEIAGSHLSNLFWGCIKKIEGEAETVAAEP